MMDKVISLITYYWWGGDPDTPDPLSGMSLRDIYNVQKHWTTIHAKSQVYGMELFLRLFRNDPITQSFFKNIEGMPESRIVKAVVFKAHVHTLMASLNTAVINLNQPEVVAALMDKLGTSHHKRQIQVEHFEGFKDVLVDFLANDLKLSETELGSWYRFVTFIYRHIFERLKD